MCGTKENAHLGSRNCWIEGRHEGRRAPWTRGVRESPGRCRSGLAAMFLTVEGEPGHDAWAFADGVLHPAAFMGHAQSKQLPTAWPNNGCLGCTADSNKQIHAGRKRDGCRQLHFFI